MIPEARVAQPVRESEAARLAREIFGLHAKAEALPGEYDDNFKLIASDGREFVLKIMHSAREAAFVEMQCAALQHLERQAPQLTLPRVCRTASGEAFTTARLEDGSPRLVWLLTFIPGTALAEFSTNARTAELLRGLGAFLGELDFALATFAHPAAHCELKWDLSRARWIRDKLHCVQDGSRCSQIERILALYESAVVPAMSLLRHSVIYGDANDHNVLVSTGSSEQRNPISVIDFGDMHHGITVSEVAIAAAYALLFQENPLPTAAEVVAGYHATFPLTESEIAVVFPLILTRLAVSVTNSAHRKSVVPDDPYVTVSEAPAWDALEKLMQIDPLVAQNTFRAACHLSAIASSASAERSSSARGGEAPRTDKSHPKLGPLQSVEETLAARNRALGKNLSVSYAHPLKIVRGWRQHLYDEAGRAYLDVYNNVPLVGHSHPRVVRAVQEQIALLNTNTRYLHDNIIRYAERLTALLPEPLRVCYFLNSGSEANELALRLARTQTRREDIVVLEHAYHGHTTTLIDISPYKFEGPGGSGRKAWVHIAPIPDDYRGAYRRGDSEAGKKYAQHVAELLHTARASGRGVAAFIAESLPSVAGQIVFPAGYLKEAYRHMRSAGGVCIADEVQVGFGRLGTHFWGFQTQDVIPDIVVLGKPIGNAFPLAAVITTREIAASFDNGMEFFSTFGGNPVACAAGLAVLDVLEEEHLQENALRVGSYLKAKLEELRKKHALIGDVRGAGLFLGLDLVLDRETRQPAPEQASLIVNRLRECAILTGTDGPHHNVIKLRPPLIFSRDDADLFVGTLDQILSQLID